MLMYTLLNKPVGYKFNFVKLYIEIAHCTKVLTQGYIKTICKLRFSQQSHEL